MLLSSFLAFHVSRDHACRLNHSTDWCCFYYITRNGVLAFPETLVARSRCAVPHNKNALFSFCCNMKSAVCAICRAIYIVWSALARTHDFKKKSVINPCSVIIKVIINQSEFFRQSKRFAARPPTCCDTIPHIVDCVRSPSSLCYHFYAIFNIVACMCLFVSRHPSASLHLLAPHSQPPLWWWCVRCLLITESPKTPSHYRYQI